MRRLYTAFVSSTFQDLRLERQRLVSVLLDHDCVPLGMEFFPSAGQTQWPIIVDSIQAADFCIFVIAGRYGSLSESGLSWTHREFREALQQNKPVAAVLHADPTALPADKRDTAPALQALLADFRSEIERTTLCRYYSDDADLVRAVASSIAALRTDERVAGWIRADPNRIDAQDIFDRVYELVETEWTFAFSKEDPATWDGFYRGHRRIVANDPNGIHSVAHDFTRDTDAQLPFGEERYPQLRITDWRRSRSGTAALAKPRKQSGSTFVQDVVFSPPLSVGETADWMLDAVCPSFKYADRNALVQATVDSRIGARTYDWASRRITYPTKLLRMTVFLPLSLGASPRGPLLSRGSSYIDNELSGQVARDGSYHYEIADQAGERCHKMTLEIENPPLQRYYRLAWNVP